MTTLRFRVTGFVGASDVDADQTVISREVRGKFSIRLVPNQDPSTVDAQVEAYVRDLHTKSGSKNDITYVVYFYYAPKKIEYSLQ